MTKVIAAFPGTGKSHYVSTLQQTAKVIDLDTNEYTQGYDSAGRVRSKDFPRNYLLAVKDCVGKADILFVGCQPEVIAALRKAGISFTLVYPERTLKTEYTDRYKQRRSPDSFISLLSKNWNIFLNFLEKQKDCQHVVLGSGEYISDVIDYHVSVKSL